MIMKSQSSYTSTSKGVDDNSDIKKLFFDFLAIWPVVLLLVLAFLGVAYYINQTTTPAYQVQATIVIKQDKNAASKELFESIGLKTTSDNMENEISIMRSFTLAYNTLKQLDFNVEYYREGLWRKVEIYNSLPYKLEVDWNHPQLIEGELFVSFINPSEFKISFKKSAFALYNPASPDQKSGALVPKELKGKFRLNTWIEGKNYRFRMVRSETPDAKLKDFSFKLRSNYSLAVSYSRALRVEPQKKESTILSLSLESSMVEKGKKYLNKIIEAYQDRELINKNRTATNTAEFINIQLKSIQDSLMYFEDQLQRYRSDNQSFDVGAQSNLALSRLATLEDEKSKIGLKLKYYQNVLGYLQKEQINQLTVPSSVGIEETVLDQLINELITIQNDRLRLNQFLSDDNRTLKDLNFRYTTVLNTLKESIRRAYETAKLSYADVEKRIGTMSGDLNKMPKVERNLLSIKRQFSISENIYTYLLQKRDEAEISRASNIPSSEVLDLARPMGGMITPKPIRNYCVAISLAFILPLLFIFVRNMFDNKIYDSKLLEQRLKVPLVGSIGRSRQNVNNIVFEQPKSFVSENFRNIRASVPFLHSGDSSLVIAFTSSVSGEGKTFCSINTAAIYALGGKKTLLVGLDLRRPKIANDFNLHNDKGVSNYLSKKCDLGSLIKASGRENLDILLSGPVPPNPAELIGSANFGAMMQELRMHYDVIILDCPPSGLVSETIDIFGESDLTFFIFRHQFSDWDAVDNINDLVEKGLIKKTYAIYNDLKLSADYGYGYGYIYGDEESKPSLMRRLKEKVPFVN